MNLALTEKALAAVVRETVPLDLQIELETSKAIIKSLAKTDFRPCYQCKQVVVKSFFCQCGRHFYDECGIAHSNQSYLCPKHCCVACGKNRCKACAEQWKQCSGCKSMQCKHCAESDENRNCQVCSSFLCFNCHQAEFCSDCNAHTCSTMLIKCLDCEDSTCLACALPNGQHCAECKATICSRCTAELLMCPCGKHLCKDSTRLTCALCQLSYHAECLQQRTNRAICPECIGDCQIKPRI